MQDQCISSLSGIARIIGTALADLPVSGGRVKRAGCVVVRRNLKESVCCAALSCRCMELVQQGAGQSLAAMRGMGGDGQNLGLVRDHPRQNEGAPVTKRQHMRAFAQICKLAQAPRPFIR